MSSSTGLWDFATSFYARPGIEAALLHLQDEEGLDVPLLIALRYAGRQGSVLDGPSLAALVETASTWERRAIAPLRRIRRDLKKSVQGIGDAPREPLRTRIKAAELEAERILIEQLEARLPPPGSADPQAAVQANFCAYLSILKHRLSDNGRARLAQLT